MVNCKNSRLNFNGLTAAEPLFSVNGSIIKILAKQKAMSEIRAAIKEVKRAEIVDRENFIDLELEKSDLGEYIYNGRMVRRLQKPTGLDADEKRRKSNEASRKSRFEKTRREFVRAKENERSTQNIAMYKAAIDADEKGIKDFEQFLADISCDMSVLDRLREPYEHDYTYPNRFRPIPNGEVKLETDKVEGEMTNQINFP